MSDQRNVSEAIRWLRWAREDLEWAERGLQNPDLVPRPACMHAQQAAEKALKAALIVSGVEYPHRHNLNALRNLLPDGWNVKTEFPELGRLSVWVIDARYPGDLPEPDRGDADQAVEQARGVVASIELQMKETQ